MLPRTETTRSKKKALDLDLGAERRVRPRTLLDRNDDASISASVTADSNSDDDDDLGAQLRALLGTAEPDDVLPVSESVVSRTGELCPFSFGFGDLLLRKDEKTGCIDHIGGPAEERQGARNCLEMKGGSGGALDSSSPTPLELGAFWGLARLGGPVAVTERRARWAAEVVRLPKMEERGGDLKEVSVSGNLALGIGWLRVAPGGMEMPGPEWGLLTEAVAPAQVYLLSNQRYLHRTSNVHGGGSLLHTGAWPPDQGAAAARSRRIPPSAMVRQLREGDVLETQLDFEKSSVSFRLNRQGQFQEAFQVSSGDECLNGGSGRVPHRLASVRWYPFLALRWGAALRPVELPAAVENGNSSLVTPWRDSQRPRQREPPTAVLLFGPPGSGKTSWAAEHVKARGGVVNGGAEIIHMLGAEWASHRLGFLGGHADGDQDHGGCGDDDIVMAGEGEKTRQLARSTLFKALPRLLRAARDREASVLADACHLLPGDRQQSLRALRGYPGHISFAVALPGDSEELARRAAGRHGDGSEKKGSSSLSVRRWATEASLPTMKREGVTVRYVEAEATVATKTLKNWQIALLGTYGLGAESAEPPSKDATKGGSIYDFFESVDAS